MRNKSTAELLIGKWQLEVMYDQWGIDITNACIKKTQLQFFKDRKLFWTASTALDGECSVSKYHEFGNTSYSLNRGCELGFHWTSRDGRSSYEVTGQWFEVSDDLLVLRRFDGHKGVVYKRIG